MSEQELARLVVEWLRGRGWDVYQEVEVERGGRRCDLVAVKRRALWAIECKTSLGLPVLAQAHGWLEHAHRVSVATRGVKSAFGARVAKDYGIGWLAVGGRRAGPTSIRQRVAPARRARVSQRLARALCDEQRSFAPAGNARARFWSPWKSTAAEVQRWVRAHPGGAFADMVREVKHHYRTQATARSCLGRHIEEGLVVGVRLARRRGRLVLLLDAPTPARTVSSRTRDPIVPDDPVGLPTPTSMPAGVFALLPPSTALPG